MMVPDAGRTRRWGRVFRPDGRSLVLAMDHGAVFGAGPPTSPEAVAPMVAAGVDAVLTTASLASRFAEVLAPVGLLVRVDGGRTGIGDFSAADNTGMVVSVETAARAGADGVTAMGYAGHPDETRSLRRLGEIADEAKRFGLLVMAEMVPFGFGGKDRWTADVVAGAARVGFELGADLIKTVVPNDGDMDAVVRACPAPVLWLGGADRLGDDGVVALAERARVAGAGGLAVGRNLWGADDPPGLIARVAAALHRA